MSGRTAFDVRCHAGSVGLLMDRTLKREEALGSVWLVDQDKVATCAHLLVLYTDVLDALKVRFPANREEWGITEAVFHPEFKVKQASQAARRSLGSPVPALALQDHNLVILTLTPGLLEPGPELVSAVNEQLSLPPPPRDRGLSGHLADLDLALVLQTITNARKEGTLIITDERNRALAKVYCRDGKIVHARYGPLTNEPAIYQVVSQHLLGNFYFQGQKQPDWPVADPIARPTDMLLIESHRRLDEIPRLLLDLGGERAVFQRAREHLEVERLPPEVRIEAQRIWLYLTGTVHIGQLWQLASLDDFAIFSALAEMAKTGQIEPAGEPDPLNRYQSRPLEMAPELPLSPWDDVDSLTVDAVAGLPRAKSGHLLGSLRPNDPWHLIHTVDLPPESAGSPIFKEGKVIGMHCGQLPPDPTLPSGSQNVYQLLWVEAVFACLDRDKAVQKGTVAPVPSAELREPSAGCREVARIDCPKCGSSSLDSAKFCKQCGQRLFQDLTLEQGRSKILALVGAALAVLLLAGGLGYYFARGSVPAPHLSAVVAPQAQIKAELDMADAATASWKAMPAQHVFRSGDLLRIRFKPSRRAYVYVFHQATTSSAAHLIYPDSQSTDRECPADEWVTIPRQTDTQAAPGRVALAGFTIYGPPGSESLIFVVSDTRGNLVGKPEEMQKAFQIANAVLSKRFSPTGLAVPASIFGAGIFPATSTGKPSNIYLTGLKISHHD